MPAWEAWEPDAAPVGEMWARVLQPPGHRDVLAGRPTTAIARGQRHVGHDWGGFVLLDCLLAQVATRKTRF